MRTIILSGGATGACRPKNFHLFRIDHIQIFIALFFPVAAAEEHGFLPLDEHQMLERTAVAHRISFHVTTTHSKTGKRTNGKAKNTCEFSLRKPAAGRVIGETSVCFPSMCGRIYDHLALRDLKFRNGKCTMA